MTGARWIETDTLANHDLSSAHEVGSYTADADRLVAIQVLLDTVAGDGDYIWYATLQVGGAGSSYIFLPKTTGPAESGETAIGGQSILVGVRDDDVLKVYVDCLPADTSVDVIVRFFEISALQPAIADRTVNVSASGVVDADAVAISGDTTAADNLESAADGAGYNLGGGSVVAASVTAGVTLANDAITDAVFDETTAFPLRSDDAGATEVARTGADGDTLETLSDQMDAMAGSDPWNTDLPGAYVAGKAGYIVGTNLDAQVSFAAAAGDAMMLTASAIDDILDEVIEGPYTLRDYLRLIAAVLLGKSGGGGTLNVSFQDTGGTKNRVEAVVDVSGNRSSVVLDAS